MVLQLAVCIIASRIANPHYNAVCYKAEDERADSMGLDEALRGMLIDLGKGMVYPISRDPGLYSTWSKAVDSKRRCYSAIISAIWTGPSMDGHVDVCGMDAYLAVAAIVDACRDAKTRSVGGAYLLMRRTQ